MNLTRRVFNNFFWLAFSEVVSKSLTFIGTIYLARVLGTSGFGQFSLALAVGAYFWIVADMGVEIYGVREIARNNEKACELYQTLSSLRLTLSIFLLGVFSIVLFVCNISLDRKLVLFAGAFYCFTYSLSSSWVFRGLEKMQYIFIGRIITTLSFLAGIYLLVHSSSDVLLASFIYSSSFLIGSMTFVYLLNRKYAFPFVYKISLRKWKNHVKESFYFAINEVFNFSLFIPIFFMGFWNTNEDIGIFSAPHRLSIMIIRTGSLVIAAFYPTLSSLYISDNAKFRKAHTKFQKMIIGIALPVCIILTILSNDIITLLYGESYAKSVGVFNVFISIIFLMLIRRGIGNALHSAGLQKFNLLATGMGAFLIIGMSIFIIPQYNAYGAAWCLLCGEIITLSVMSYLFRQKVYELDFFKSYIFKVLFAGFIMALLLNILPFSKLINILLAIISYGIVSLSIGVIKMENIQEFYFKLIKQ